MKLVGTVVLLSLAAVSCGGSGEGTLAKDAVPQPCVVDQYGNVRVVNGGSVILLAAVNGGSVHTLNPGQSFSVEVPEGDAIVHSQCQSGGTGVVGQDTLTVPECQTVTWNHAPCG